MSDDLRPRWFVRLSNGNPQILFGDAAPFVDDGIKNRVVEKHKMTPDQYGLTINQLCGLYPYPIADHVFK